MARASEAEATSRAAAFDESATMVAAQVPARLDHLLSPDWGRVGLLVAVSDHRAAHEHLDAPVAEVLRRGRGPQPEAFLPTMRGPG